jgi:hypothetical protein
MGNLNCYIHKDRTAVSKCDECGKYICLECQHDSSESSFSSSNTTKIKICPFCYADKIENDLSSVGPLFGCIVFVIFAFILIFIFSSLGNSFPFSSPFEQNSELPGIAIAFILFSVFLIIGVIAFLFSKKQNEPNKEAETIRARAKKAIEESKKIITTSEKQTPLYCRYCGAPIEVYEKTCSYCGMNWIWKQDS